MADCQVCVLISFKNEVETIFTKGSDFEKNLKPRVQSILGDNYKFIGSGFNKIGYETAEVQCSIEINKDLKLSVRNSENIN